MPTAKGPQGSRFFLPHVKSWGHIDLASSTGSPIFSCMHWRDRARLTCWVCGKHFHCTFLWEYRCPYQQRFLVLDPLTYHLSCLLWLRVIHISVWVGWPPYACSRNLMAKCGPWPIFPGPSLTACTWFLKGWEVYSSSYFNLCKTASSDNRIKLCPMLLILFSVWCF